MKNMMARQRRVRRSRGKISELGAIRLSVHRTAQHIYAQVFSPCGSQVLACASSVEKELKEKSIGPGKIAMAEAVGALESSRRAGAGHAVAGAVWGAMKEALLARNPSR